MIKELSAVEFFVTDEEFRKFLIDNNEFDKEPFLYDRYVNNFKNFRRINFEDFFESRRLPRPSYLSAAFPWSETNEGGNFWATLSNKWKKMILDKEIDILYCLSPKVKST